MDVRCSYMSKENKTDKRNTSKAVELSLEQNAGAMVVTAGFLFPLQRQTPVCTQNQTHGGPQHVLLTTTTTHSEHTLPDNGRTMECATAHLISVTDWSGVRKKRINRYVFHHSEYTRTWSLLYMLTFNKCVANTKHARETIFLCQKHTSELQMKHRTRNHFSFHILFHDRYSDYPWEKKTTTKKTETKGKWKRVCAACRQWPKLNTNSCLRTKFDHTAWKSPTYFTPAKGKKLISVMHLPRQRQR